MSNKLRRIIAIIALAFMLLFTASFIAWCFNRSLFNGQIGFAAIFTGGLGIALFFILNFVKPKNVSEGDNEKKDENVVADEKSADESNICEKPNDNVITEEKAVENDTKE